MNKKEVHRALRHTSTFYPELARIFFLLLFLHFMACKYIGSVFAIVY